MTKNDSKNRLPVWARPATSRIDPVVFHNCFFNARGEFSSNLETSKSKVAIKLREERAAAAAAKAEQEQREEQERIEKAEDQRKLDADLATSRREFFFEQQRKLEIADLQREVRTTSVERDNKIKLALHNTILDPHEKRDLLRTAAWLAKQIVNLRAQLHGLKKGR
jgi:cation diffusion facilitator CzcD-associated flavoprotein CzcO